MATDTATARKSRAKEKPEPEPADVEQTEGGEEEGKVEAVPDTDAQARVDQEEQLEILEPKDDPKRWVIGKPSEHGGTEDEYSVYIQRPLGYMARMRFFALVSNTIADAIKSGGMVNISGTDLDSIRNAGSLNSDDFADAASFMTLAMQLVGYAPDFLLDCYILWLEVPAVERTWAKMVMEQSYAPDRNKWGLTEDQGIEMVEVFIDQNYDDIREFFSGKLPRLAQRVREREAARKKARESGSAQSKR